MDNPLICFFILGTNSSHPGNTLRHTHLYLIIANTTIFSSSIPFLLNMALYHHTHLFFSSLVLLTHFCLIHHHLCDGIGGTVTLEVTQLVTIPLYPYVRCRLTGKIIQTSIFRRKIQRPVFKSQLLTDSLSLVYEVILRDRTKFPTSPNLINHHLSLFNKCAYSSHGHFGGNFSHSSKRILCLSYSSKSIYIQFMFK